MHHVGDWVFLILILSAVISLLGAIKIDWGGSHNRRGNGRRKSDRE